MTDDDVIKWAKNLRRDDAIPFWFEYCEEDKLFTVPTQKKGEMLCQIPLDIMRQFAEQVVGKDTNVSTNVTDKNVVKSVKDNDVLEMKYLKYVRRVIDDLAKNISHSAGIDFMAFNEAGIETERRIAELQGDLSHD